MNLDALPYTSFIVLVEFAVGSLLVCLLAQWRGRVAASFVKFAAAMVTVAAAIMVVNTLVLDPKSAIGGYRLDDALLTWVKVGSIAFLAASLPYNWFVQREDPRNALRTGSVAALVGLALVAVVSYYVSLPTWGFAGALLSIAAGTIAVGAVVLAMTLGHWYLVTPRLPREPLEELTLLLVAAVVVQSLLLVVNDWAPVPGRARLYVVRVEPGLSSERERDDVGDGTPLHCRRRRTRRRSFGTRADVPYRRPRLTRNATAVPHPPRIARHPAQPASDRMEALGSRPR